MSVKLIYICLLCSSLRLAGGGPGTKVSVNADQLPFGKFALELYEQSGVTLFYREEWVKDIRVTLHRDSISVLDAVREAVKGYDLNVSVWNKNIILMKGKGITARLPEFEQQSATDGRCRSARKAGFHHGK